MDREKHFEWAGRIVGFCLAVAIIIVLIAVLMPSAPHKSGIATPLVAKGQWAASCNEYSRVEAIKTCLTNYYRINKLHDVAGVVDERQAFERCRASSSYQFCEWKIQ